MMGTLVASVVAAFLLLSGSSVQAQTGQSDLTSGASTRTLGEAECMRAAPRQTVVTIDAAEVSARDVQLIRALVGNDEREGLFSTRYMTPGEPFFVLIFDSNRQDPIRADVFIRGCFPGAEAMAPPRSIDPAARARKIREQIVATLREALRQGVEGSPNARAGAGRGSYRYVERVAELAVSGRQATRMVHFGTLPVGGNVPQKISDGRQDKGLFERVSLRVFGVSESLGTAQLGEQRETWRKHLRMNGGWVASYAPTLPLENMTSTFRLGEAEYFRGRGRIYLLRNGITNSGHAWLYLSLRNDNTVKRPDWLTLAAPDRAPIVLPVLGTMTCIRERCEYEGKIEGEPEIYGDAVDAMKRVRLLVEVPGKAVGGIRTTLTESERGVGTYGLVFAED